MLWILIIIVFVIVTISHIFNKKEYDNSEYAKHTNISYYGTLFSKGSSGEYKVAKVIGATNKNKFVIHDLIIQQNGKSSQIDHIVIQTNGIFVIETKNYAGRIYGYETAREWTQSLAYGNVKHKIYNPIKQNKSHIYYISRALREHKVFVPFVVFPKAEMFPDIQGVGDLRDLRNALAGNTDIKLASDKIRFFYNKLMKLKRKNNISKSEHIHNIKKVISDTRNNICPRCGKELVLRRGKFSKFYGCSNYPNCKFTKPY